MKREIEIYYLEMTSPAELRPSPPRPAGFRVERARIPAPGLNRFFYSAVGGDWSWIDRLGWTLEQWRAWVDRPELETWIGYLEGTPAGYFELERRPEGGVELAYFGLLPGFLGRGIGGALLTAAAERAWEMGAARVTVNTCSLDAPAALRNYEARGSGGSGRRGSRKTSPWNLRNMARDVAEGYDGAPMSLEEIKEAVAHLSKEDRHRFRHWFLEKDAEAWDREMEEDARAGRLDFLVEEGLRDFQTGKARKL